MTTAMLFGLTRVDLIDGFAVMWRTRTLGAVTVASTLSEVGTKSRYQSPGAVQLQRWWP